MTEKFKELKSLIYEYKERKETEVNQLNDEQINLKNEIDKNKNEYEKIIDNATNEIEIFINKTNTDKPLQ